MKISVKKVSREQLELVRKFEFLRDTFRLRFYERFVMYLMLSWLRHFQLGEVKLAVANSYYSDMKKWSKKRGKH